MAGYHGGGWPKGKPRGKTWNKGVPMSEESRRRVSASKMGSTPWNKGKSGGTNSLKGRPKSETHKAALAKVAIKSWYGGSIGDAFAAVLCPAGFQREYLLYYGEPTFPMPGHGALRRRRFNLDFAHVEAKVNIELDGPSHKTTLEQDATRDRELKALGWKVIRIKHGGVL